MLTKKINYFLLFLIISILFISCGKDEEISYPVTYTYNQVEYDDFLLFKITDNGTEAIPFNERLSAIEPIVRADVALSVEDNEIGFNQITLLSEDEMLFLNTDFPTDSFFISYTQLSATLLRADLSGNGTEPFELMLTDNNNELRYCFQSSVFFLQPPNNINNGSLDFESCKFSQSVDEAINDIRIDENLVANDTLFYNRVDFILTKN